MSTRTTRDGLPGQAPMGETLDGASGAGPSGPAAGPRGFTLLEVLMATVVMAVAMVGVTWALSATGRTKEVLTEQPFTARILANEILELARTLPREPSGTLAARNLGNVLALDSLIGAEFSPPIRADGTTDTSLSAWTQRVALSVHGLDDVKTATADNPGLGIGRLDAKLYKLQVTVLKDGAVVDTYEWLLNP